MDSGLLKAFLAVSAEQSISLGARKIGSSQSNITARIRQLEKDLGVQLFHRVPQGVVLTDIGRRLEPLIGDALNKIEQIYRNVRALQDELWLDIASTEANCAVRIQPFIETLYAEFPHLELSLVTGTSTENLEKVLNYEVDVAFINGKPTDSAIAILNSFDETMVLARAKDHKKDDFIIYRDGCAFNRYAQEYIAKHDIEARVIKFASYETILNCVSSGLGQTILPMSIIEKLGFKDALELKPLEKPDMDTYLIARRDNIPPIGDFLRSIKITEAK